MDSVKNFGFGCMRLPMIDKKVDIEQTKKMVDLFIENGFTYFDTAHGYIDEQSEPALKECLTSRYPRNTYTLTDKLTADYFEKEEDIKPFVKKQLEICGVEYFDYYLMHAQSSNNYDKFQKCHAYEVAQELKKEGLVKHVGFSFHDSPEFLDKILTEHPEVEVVQIQFNYLDMEAPHVQSKKCYEVCVKHGKEVIVMEPVKGGSLVNLPDNAKKVLDDLNNGSTASYALRFVGSFENVKMILSGMSTTEQMIDNISTMKEFKKLSNDEFNAIDKVVSIYKEIKLIPCTSCHYCTKGCPQQIDIPLLFSIMNDKEGYGDWTAESRYNEAIKTSGKASDCVKCGNCENVCPQHLPIRSLLEKVSSTFEKNAK